MRVYIVKQRAQNTELCCSCGAKVIINGINRLIIANKSLLFVFVMWSLFAKLCNVKLIFTATYI